MVFVVLPLYLRVFEYVFLNSFILISLPSTDLLFV